MQTIKVNGYDMAYLGWGSGPPLVLVHGTLGDFRTYLEFGAGPSVEKSTARSP